MPALTRKTTFAKMRAAGLSGMMLLVLNGCLFDNLGAPTDLYVPPSPPSQAPNLKEPAGASRRVLLCTTVSFVEHVAINRALFRSAVGGI
jgi:hypothetical protein